MKLQHVTKIGVLRANALGDFIFSLPAFCALKETYPKAEIVLLGCPWHAYFLQNRKNPIDRVIVVPPSKGVRIDEKEDIEELEYFYQKMRLEMFDVLIQIHGGGRYSNTFIKNMNPRLTIGLRTQDAPLLDKWIPYIYYQKEIFRYLEVVSLIDAKTKKIEPIVHVSKEDLKEAYPLFSQIGKPFIVIHPGATDIRRRWSPKKFAQIADVLIQKGFTVVITGTISEKNIIDEMLSNMKYMPINTCGKLSLKALTGVLSKALLVVANDTGPLHLAESLQTPTVGIYWYGNVINGSSIFKTIHRQIISWTLLCPLCKIECAKNFPFEPKKETCTHAVSFVNEISEDEVIKEIFDLLLFRRNYLVENILQK